MHRYVGFMWHETDPRSAAIAQGLAQRLRSQATRWATVADERGLLVLQANIRPGAFQPYPLHGRGLIVGRLFKHRMDTPRNPALTQEDAARIAQSAGQELIDSYWGRYVAFLKVAPGKHCIVRDPSGALQSYYFRAGGLTVVFSNIEDCMALRDRALNVNLEHVISFLRFNRLVTAETGFKEISSVHAGESLTVSGETVTKRFLWDPTHVCKLAPLVDPKSAEEVLQQTILTAVRSWGSCYDKLLLELSGGLDSSIVATCLSGAPNRPDVICSNVYTNDPEGDERPYARSVAAHCGFELIETALETQAASIELSINARFQISPVETHFVPATERLRAALVQQRRPRALFSGQGGDHLFQQRRDPLIAAEYLHRHGLRSGYVNVVLDTARMCGLSASTVLRRTLLGGKTLTPSQLYETMVAPPFIATELRPGSLPVNAIHPWLLGDRGLPAAKYRQIADLVDTQICYKYPCHYADIVHPLISQPVIECALRIPAYVLTTGGVPRALMRQAFARQLPSEVSTRVSKGGVTGYYHRMVASNLRFIREFLLDGALVRHHVLDKPMLDAALKEDELIRSGQIDPILKSLLAEAWLREASSQAAQSRAA